MTEVNQIYKCEICGNIVEVKHAGGGELVCCGKVMSLLEANSEDVATEKHVPVVASSGGRVHVRIGEVEHPMDNKHFIEWIAIVTKNETETVYLAPGDKPEAVFTKVTQGGTVYAYCNLHGLWKAEL